FTLQVPALRERDNDREFLAAYFLSLFSAQLNKPQLKLSSETLSVLHSYPFPGNVRELQNAMERAATFCEGTSVEPQHLPERIARFAAQETQGSSISNNNPLAPWLRTKPELIPLDKLQLHYVEYVLEQTKGNKRKAADILGVTRRTLYRWLDNDRAQAGSEL